MLNELPFFFQKKYSGTKGCTCTKEETITYSLTLKFLEDCDIDGKMKKAYLLYYAPNDTYFDIKPPYIGDNTGMGKNSLEELIDDLKKILKDNDIKI